MSAAPCILFTEPGKVTVSSLTPPPCGPTDIAVETLVSVISPGTELRMLAGHYGSAGQFPYVPGYNSIGRVSEVGVEAEGWRVGDLVSAINPLPNDRERFLYGAHAARQVHATTIDQRPILLPAGADPVDYALTEIAAISFRGVTAARAQPQETAVVLGQGLIGALSAGWLLAAGCRVAVVDVEPSRIAQALERGVALALNGHDADLIARLKVFTRGGADIVVEATGLPSSAAQAWQLLRAKPVNAGPGYVRDPIHFYSGDWPRLVFQANYLEPAPFEPHGQLTGEGAIVIAPKDRGLEDRLRVVEQTRLGRFRSRDWLDLTLPYTEAAEGYAALKARRVRSVILDWRA